jgi:hypothetical protein
VELRSEGIEIAALAFGLVPNLEKEADRIARMGYVAIGPDVYHRQAPDNTGSYDDLPKAVAMMRTLEDGQFIDDMRATLGCLRGMAEVGHAAIGVTTMRRRRRTPGRSWRRSSRGTCLRGRSSDRVRAPGREGGANPFGPTASQLATSSRGS